MRAIWSGAISFGLVNIPVKLYPATISKDVRFRLLHDRCRTPLRYVRRCPACEEDVEPSETIRGYEYARGHYVLFTDDELEALPLPGKGTIEISDFVKLDEIDSIYFESPYYLAPVPSGRKAYFLLQRALVESNKVAVARLALRSRESLAALRAFGPAILLETMFFADEVRGLEELSDLNWGEMPQASEAERTMASQLIDSLTASFEPGRYQDNYRQGLLEIAERKAAGQDVPVVPQAPPAKVVDLVEALRASLEQAQGRGKVKAARSRRSAGKRQTGA